MAGFIEVGVDGWPVAVGGFHGASQVGEGRDSLEWDTMDCDGGGPGCAIMSGCLAPLLSQLALLADGR